MTECDTKVSRRTISERYLREDNEEEPLGDALASLALDGDTDTVVEVCKLPETY